MNLSQQFARPDNEPGQSGIRGRLPVQLAIADNERSHRPDRPVKHGAPDHTGGGLAVRMALPPKVRHNSVLVERTHIPGIDMRAMRAKLVLHGAMKAIDIRGLVKASREAGLIGDHDGKGSRIVHRTNRLDSSGEEDEIFDFVGIAVVNVQRTVPVEKNGRSAHAVRQTDAAFLECFGQTDVDEKPVDLQAGKLT